MLPPTGVGEAPITIDDPMAIDTNTLAEQAGASKPKLGKERPLLAGQRLEDQDVLLLNTPVPEKDMAFEQLRAHTNNNLAKLVAEYPVAKDNQGPLAMYATGAMREQALDDLCARGFKVHKQIAKQARKVTQGKPEAINSPAKIMSAADLLFKPQVASTAATESMSSLLRAAVDMLSTAGPEKAASELLGSLLMSHKQAKRTRATKQCFTQHVASARNTLLQAISSAVARDEHKLAYDVLLGLRNLEEQMNKFLAVCEKIGFESARDAYVNKGNSLGGMSDEVWSLVTGMAANGEHAAIFSKLLADQHLKLPAPKPAAAASNRSSEDEDEAPRKRSKHTEPYCTYCCIPGHAQANCRKWLALMSGGGGGAGGAGGRKQQPKGHRFKGKYLGQSPSK